MLTFVVRTVAGLALALLLAGCGGESGSQSTTAGTPEPAKTTPAADSSQGSNPPATTDPKSPASENVATAEPPAEKASPMPADATPSDSDPTKEPEPASETNEPVASVEPAPSAGTPNGKAPPKKENKPPAADWKQPQFAFILSGELQGYIEPCGCSENQLGGLSHRADFIKQMTDRGWGLVPLDLGGLVKRSNRQSQVKFETMLAEMRDMNQAALGLGPEELRFGAPYLLSQGQPPVDGSAAIPFLSANVVLFGSPELGTPVPWKLIEVGGAKVAVTSILGEGLKKTLQENDTEITVSPPADALAAVLPKMKEAQPDLLVLLSHAEVDETKSLIEKFPEFDLVLTAGGPEDPDDRPTMIGKTMLLLAGHKGKYVGLVGYYPDNAGQKLKFELVQLDRERFKDPPHMVAHMKAYQERLLDEQLAATEPSLPHLSGATFVGAEKCGECHKTAYDIWAKSKHSHAFEDLRDARNGQEAFKGITREFDAECLACHVTGWHNQEVYRFDSGFLNVEFAKTDAEKLLSQQLKGVQCESCHGPGSKHIELLDSDVEAAKLAVRLTLEQAKSRACYGCHDLDNSPKFSFEKYWPDVEHKGLD